MANQTPMAFNTFEGTTTVATVKIHSQIAKTYGMPDPYPKVLEILAHTRFEELAVVSLLINQMGGIVEVNTLAYDMNDLNAQLILEYHTRLRHSIERSMNQGLKERNQINGFHVLAAERVVWESGLIPHKTLQDLPALEQIDGLSEYERGVNRLLDNYDRSGMLERY